MSYEKILHEYVDDPEQIELAYMQAMRAGEQQAFAQAIYGGYESNPGNMLFAAWYYRLAYSAESIKGRAIAWAWAIPLAVLNGLLLWLLSDDAFFVQVNGSDYLPAVVLLAAPLCAAFILLYLALAGERLWRRMAVPVIGLAVLTAYVFGFYARIIPYAFTEQYLTLAAIHLPVLAIAAIGLYLLWGARDADNRFAFLIKCLEAIILGGLFGIALAVFTGITFALFEALGISPADAVVRLFIAGGGGIIPLLTVAILYDPQRTPDQQSFQEGLSKLIATLMRILLVPTLLVLLIYLLFIPFNFRQPFENRDVLITYNIMLFAVMALLLGATPVRSAEPSASQQRWLRRAIIVIAVLALVVSLYAFAAIVYRTAIDKWTPNRIVFIGWNVINIGVLILLLAKQTRAGSAAWMARLRQTLAAATIPYAAWALAILLIIPWLFSADTAEIESLPPSIQQIVYQQPYPILLKCYSSPHIYLLENGEKRWVKDISTFEAQGFEWSDVRSIAPCDDLFSLPDGLPIPPDAGQPPE